MTKRDDEIWFPAIFKLKLDRDDDDGRSVCTVPTYVEDRTIWRA